jgi:hypothetical protein
MAEPKTTKTRVYNQGEGPRSFTAADGGAVVLRPGESWEGEIVQQEADDFGPDLATGKDADKAAKAEGDEDGEGTGEGTGDPGNPAGGVDAAAIAAEAETLERSNNRDALVQLAKDEGVKHESDANKPTIALLIAQKRAGVI